MYEININELKTINGRKLTQGYRMVYFYNDGTYFIGTFSETIELFMIEFTEYEFIESLNDVPKFTSIDDILTRYLDTIPNIKAAAIYNVNGECIQIKEKKNV